MTKICNKKPNTRLKQALKYKKVDTNRNAKQDLNWFKSIKTFSVSDVHNHSLKIGPGVLTRSSLMEI